MSNLLGYQNSHLWIHQLVLTLDADVNDADTKAVEAVIQKSEAMSSEGETTPPTNDAEKLSAHMETTPMGHKSEISDGNGGNPSASGEDEGESQSTQLTHVPIPSATCEYHSS